jgi:hypothetical protein
MAVYRLLVDHYVGTTYCEAGSVVSDSGPGALLPAGWTPTTACDPIDVQAVQNFWNAGPRGQSDAEPSRGLGPWWSAGRWQGVPVKPPAYYWVRQGDGRFILRGAEHLGPHDPT